ncbi:MAG: outer membrane beta-barrel protein [Chitinivibrionales bacterium]|nr:outer membrane beta-barrel protein [Chitinivibrionales bacterium]
MPSVGDAPSHSRSRPLAIRDRTDRFVAGHIRARKKHRPPCLALLLHEAQPGLRVLAHSGEPAHASALTAMSNPSVEGIRHIGTFTRPNQGGTMTRDLSCTLTALVAFLTISVSTARAESGFQLGLDVGASSVTGADFEDLAIGFSVAGDAFYGFNDYVFVGGRFGWVRWGPLRSSFLDAVANAVSSVDADGSAWSLEIVPAARVTTAFERNVVNIFAAFGAGLYILNNDITIEAVVVDTLGNLNTVEVEPGDGASAHFGISLAGGFVIGEGEPILMRVYPIWNYVVRDDSPDQYLTVNIGLVWVF